LARKSYDDEEVGPLAVIAGIALARSGQVPLGDLRRWVNAYGAGQAWSLPIMITIDKEEEK